MLDMIVIDVAFHGFLRKKPRRYALPYQRTIRLERSRNVTSRLGLRQAPITSNRLARLHEENLRFFFPSSKGATSEKQLQPNTAFKSSFVARSEHDRPAAGPTFESSQRMLTSHAAIQERTLVTYQLIAGSNPIAESVFLFF